MSECNCLEGVFITPTCQLVNADSGKALCGAETVGVLEYQGGNSWRAICAAAAAQAIAAGAQDRRDKPQAKQCPACGTKDPNLLYVTTCLRCGADM